MIESAFVAAGISEGAGVIEYDGENDQKQKRESTVTDSFPPSRNQRETKCSDSVATVNNLPLASYLRNHVFT